MKKIWLTIAGSLFIALGTLSAQERTSDTTGTGTTQSTEYQQQWRDEDREQLTRDDLPTGLIETLESGQYEGWENATIYRNKTSSDYMLVIQDNGNTRTFYFDKEGKEHSRTPEDSGSSSSIQYQPGQDDQEDTQQQGDTEQPSSTFGRSSTTGSKESSPGSKTSGDEVVTPQDSTSLQDAEESTTGAPVISDTTTSSSMNDRDESGAVSDQPTSTVTGSSTQTSSTTSEEDQGLQTTPGTGEASAEWNKEDRVVITTNELPSSLLITLGDPKYRGWDNSTVYRNRKTNEYMIEIRDGSDTRTYYFDKDGKAVVHSTTPGTDN
jgi:hypothetical protein